MTLKEAILKRVNENSGGIKFTALVVDLVVLNTEERIRPELPMSPEFTRVVEQACKDMPEIEMLDYGMALGDGMQRVKTFVYTPLTT
jgi:hypothetical protein